LIEPSGFGRFNWDSHRRGGRGSQIIIWGVHHGHK
jgi:hypothetical protein